MRRAIWLLLLWPSLAGAVPATMAFSARITTTTSGPVSGKVSIRFVLYDAAEGGQGLWEETYPDLVADDGLVFAALGSQTPLGDEVFAAPQLFLQIDVDGTPQTPRIGIHSVPYAARAGVAEKLGSLTEADVARVSDTPRAVHTHDGGDIVSGTIPIARLACYADLESEGYLDAANNEDLLTRAQSDGRYAAVSHNHTASAITTGTLANARYDAYDNLSTAQRLDGADATDVVLRSVGDTRWSMTTHNHDATYAPLSHNHDASAINAGTLDTGRYDAYQDLSDAGRLDFNANADLVRRTDLLNYEASGVNYGGCGSYSTMSCSVFFPDQAGPACDAVPVGGICRVPSGPNICGQIDNRCGDGSSWYLKTAN